MFITFFLIRHLYFSGVWFGVASRMDTLEDVCSKKIGLTCLKHDYHSKCYSQHDCGDVYGQLMSMRNHEESGYDLDLDM